MTYNYMSKGEERDRKKRAHVPRKCFFTSVFFFFFLEKCESDKSVLASRQFGRAAHRRSFYFFFFSVGRTFIEHETGEMLV